MTSKQDLANAIDHTLLAPSATRDQIVKLCAEARAHHLHSVCVNPYWVATAAGELAGSEVKVCTVIGFPLGANTAETKAYEAQTALADGATELDMVINVGALVGGDDEAVRYDIATIVDVAKPHRAIVKVIIETCLLDDAQKVRACQLAKAAGADFVKTSTGFSKAGATVEDVALMRATVGDEMGVKASGGVRTLADAAAMLDAGATRIGASASLAILSAAEGKLA